MTRYLLYISEFIFIEGKTKTLLQFHISTAQFACLSFSRRSLQKIYFFLKFWFYQTSIKKKNRMFYRALVRRDCVAKARSISKPSIMYQTNYRWRRTLPVLFTAHKIKQRSSNGQQKKRTLVKIYEAFNFALCFRQAWLPEDSCYPVQWSRFNHVRVRIFKFLHHTVNAFLLLIKIKYLIELFDRYFILIIYNECRKTLMSHSFASMATLRRLRITDCQFSSPSCMSGIRQIWEMLELLRTDEPRPLTFSH